MMPQGSRGIALVTQPLSERVQLASEVANFTFDFKGPPSQGCPTQVEQETDMSH